MFPKSSCISAGEEYVAWDRLRSRHPLQNISVRTHGSSKAFRHLRSIWVWGERNSCTSSITESLSNNFNVEVNGGVPWKHSFMRNANITLANEIGPTLHLLITRHPYEWMVSMQRGGFGASLLRTQNMSEFLRTEWVSFLDDEPVLEQYAREHPPKIIRFDHSLPASPPNTPIPLHTAPRPLWLHKQIFPLPDCVFGHVSALRRSQACDHGGRRFLCTPVPGVPRNADWTSREDSPLQGCFGANRSATACPTEAPWLCLDPHPFLTELAPGAWALAAALLDGPKGTRALDDFI
eukprot:CAMPEP_0113693512 /NCGR_PEP_ID=MMETSP0038_2-20120614/19705_1 /TAXON_ID=2898 /ORGANISM="Cryptomonas paramecium" /LENGTH=292 /DNA_ID=CAMNT_0000615591 /DNA_START=468 /DNA_END=1343 /DNA_ORIENTATION=+ /assembly_acc=CAM_ASM_000170